MITGETLTAAEAVQQYGLAALVNRQCVAISTMYGNGSVDMVIGEIVDPTDCVIDEPDGSALYVQYWSVDDWYLTGVAPDEKVVLLDEVAA